MDSPTTNPTETVNRANAIAVPIFCVVSILITYLPFQAFRKVGNFAACNLIIVNDIINTFYFVNTILWPNDDWTTWWPGYGLCDIQAVLKFPLTLALACSLCRLTQGTADCLDVDKVQLNTTTAMKRRKIMFDVLFCWGPPLYEVILHYTVQNGRYVIAPVYGCLDSLDNAWPVVFIYLIWIPLLMILTLYYAIMVLIRLLKYRKNFSSTLASCGSGIAPKKFMKLILTSFSLIIIYLPIQSTFFSHELPPYLTSYSWSRIHNPLSWNPVEYIHTSDNPVLQYYAWASISWNFVIFLFYGFNDEAINTYRRLMVKCGLGYIWPSLKQPRLPRQHSRPGSPTRSSLSSHLDLVAKVMQYFDSDARKHSQSTSVTPGAHGLESSRKGSLGGTFDHITLTNIATNGSAAEDRRGQPSPNSPSHPSDYSNDLITPIPSAGSVHLINDKVEQETIAIPVQRPGGILSAFRTVITLPFPILSRKSTKTTIQPIRNRTFSTSEPGMNHSNDIESQHALSNAPTTVSTKIWSGSPLSPTPNSSASHPSVTHNKHESQEMELDPLAPKMGTRAYRERERREMEEQKREEMTRQLSENVRKHIGLELQSSSPGKVVVMTNLDRRESDA